MRDAEDEPLFTERVAGLDIARSGVEATIRVPSDTRPAAAGKRHEPSAPPGRNCWPWRTGWPAGR
jgi:hypothetical protein